MGQNENAFEGRTDGSKSVNDHMKNSLKDQLENEGGLDPITNENKLDNEAKTADKTNISAPVQTALEAEEANSFSDKIMETELKKNDNDNEGDASNEGDDPD